MARLLRGRIAPHTPSAPQAAKKALSTSPGASHAVSGGHLHPADAEQDGDRMEAGDAGDTLQAIEGIGFGELRIEPGVTAEMGVSLAGDESKRRRPIDGECGGHDRGDGEPPDERRTSAAGVGDGRNGGNVHYSKFL